MRYRSTLIIFLIFLTLTLNAQSPNGFNYQAIARDGSGSPITNTSLQVKLAVMADSLGTTIYWEELFNPVTTNAFGLFTVVLGQGLRQATSTIPDFPSVNWKSWPLFVRTQIYYQGAWKDMGSSRLWSVPYALNANTLTGSQQYLNIKGNTAVMDSALFVVRNNTGQIIFAVYNEGVRIYVDDGIAKGTVKGGFAIGGFGTAKGPSQEYFRVTRDSTRVYVNQLAKGATKGGFAIGGFSPVKGNDTTRFLNITPQNYFIGYGAGNASNPGLYNSFMGYHAGFKNQGSYNSYIGYMAGSSNTSGSQNIFLGYKAGASDTASYNVFIGNQAGLNNFNGIYNTFIGYQAGMMNTSGGANIFIGQQAGLNNTTGNSNVYLGYYSGLSKTAGLRNIFIGNGSGMNSGAGNDNILLGTAAGLKNAANNNVFIGNYSGAGNLKGSSNIYIGLYSGFADTTGSWNIFEGEGAGQYNMGSNNIILGYQAGYLSSTGNTNLMIGTQAGAHNIGDNNLFLGYQSGWTNTSGTNNIFLGTLSGGYNSTGSNNVYIGNQSGYNSTAGGQNIGIGIQSGYSTTTGVSNIFIGYQAGYSNTTGMQNIFEGTQSGGSNTTGYNNIFIGVASGQNNTDGYNNVFLGMQTGNRNTTGNFNTSLGYLAGFFNQTGSSNVFIGYQAGYNETGSNRLYISNNPGDQNNALIYGEFDTRNLTFNGNVGIGKTSPATKLDVAGGNWSVAGTSEGDFRIGDASYRLKIGVATGGGGAGDVRITAMGGTSRMILGGNGVDVLTVTSADIYPWSDNIFSFGTSGNRWTSVYAVNGTIQTSDVRLKTNIRDIPYGLESILRLKPVSFTWRDEKEGQVRLGLIAQDVVKVVSEVVDKGNDPAITLGLNYTGLIPVLIKGMQEQQKQIESARNENSDLKDQVRVLRDELEKVKTDLSSKSDK